MLAKQGINEIQALLNPLQSLGVIFGVFCQVIYLGNDVFEFYFYALQTVVQFFLVLHGLPRCPNEFGSTAFVIIQRLHRRLELGFELLHMIETIFFVFEFGEFVFVMKCRIVQLLELESDVVLVAA